MRALQYKLVVEMAQIAYMYSGSFRTQFCVSRDLFTALAAEEAPLPTLLPQWLTAASRIQNCA